MATSSFFGDLTSGASNLASSVTDFFSLDNAIHPNSRAQPQDVLKTKSALNTVGAYEKPAMGLTDRADSAMFEGIKSFQRQSGLKVDGIINPKGPTATALEQRLALREGSQEIPKPKTAVIPQGETVPQRLRSLMQDSRYRDKNDPSLRRHVTQQFEKAYKGPVSHDATGRMIQPSPVTRPDEVEPFDPNGELRRPSLGEQKRAFQVVESGQIQTDGQTSPVKASSQANEQETIEPKRQSSTPYPDIDSDFLFQQEGFVKELYVPTDDNQEEFGESGATIGAGVDLGQMNERDLQNLVDTYGVSQDTADKLRLYLGYKGEAAQERITALAQENNGQALELSEEELKTLSQAKHTQLFKVLEKNYNADSSIKFTDLPPEMQTVIGSVALQYGPHMRNEGRAPKFWGYVTHQDWSSALAELDDFKDKHRSRRKREAKRLRQYFD